MKRLAFAAAARSDLEEIARHTEQQWGATQKRRYLGAIRRRLHRLRRYPALGKSRDEIGSGYRSLTVGRHVVFYREAATDILIVRVLHDRMDVHRYFDLPLYE